MLLNQVFEFILDHTTKLLQPPAASAKHTCVYVVSMYLLVLGLFTRNPGKPERVFESLEYFRAGTRSIYDFRVRASRV